MRRAWPPNCQHDGLSRLLTCIMQRFKNARSALGRCVFVCRAANCRTCSTSLCVCSACWPRVFLALLNEIAKALRTAMRDQPDEARKLSILYAQLGMLSPRLEKMQATTELLLKSAESEQNSVPVANGSPLKPATAAWTAAYMVIIKAHASPIFARHHAAQQFPGRGCARQSSRRPP